MREHIRSTVSSGGRISRELATWLYQEADDALLKELAGTVRARFHPPRRATYLKMAIVNYTNVCVARCDYCAFYRFPGDPESYLLSTEQVCAKIEALVAHGGTLVGFNGGFHPDLHIEHYTELFRTVRARYPDVEFYEMTVAEFMFVTKRQGLDYDESARRFHQAGTRWITGGGAEVLDDAFRLRHSPAKYKVDDFYEAQRALIRNGVGTTATMVIGFDETLDERMNHLERLRDFQDELGVLPSFLCWTYKPHNTDLAGEEVPLSEYLRWLAVCRVYLDNIEHIRTSVLTRNADAMLGLLYGADDFDLPTEDEVTQMAGATISHDFEIILQSARQLGFEPVARAPLTPQES
ncbi:MAG TPA: radical SAM protein [Myxococcota bacterium]|nr:radical SAM protein [Myxococcota bacterium]